MTEYSDKAVGKILLGEFKTCMDSKDKVQFYRISLTLKFKIGMTHEELVQMNNFVI